jgi:hypothetical protein
MAGFSTIPVVTLSFGFYFKADYGIAMVLDRTGRGFVGYSCSLTCCFPVGLFIVWLCTLWFGFGCSWPQWSGTGLGGLYPRGALTCGFRGWASAGSLAGICFSSCAGYLEGFKLSLLGCPAASMRSLLATGWHSLMLGAMVSAASGAAADGGGDEGESGAAVMVEVEDSSLTSDAGSTAGPDSDTSSSSSSSSSSSKGCSSLLSGIQEDTASVKDNDSGSSSSSSNDTGSNSGSSSNGNDTGSSSGSGSSGHNSSNGSGVGRQAVETVYAGSNIKTTFQSYGPVYLKPDAASATDGSSVGAAAVQQQPDAARWQHCADKGGRHERLRLSHMGVT